MSKRWSKKRQAESMLLPGVPGRGAATHHQFGTAKLGYKARKPRLRDGNRYPVTISYLVEERSQTE